MRFIICLITEESVILKLQERLNVRPKLKRIQIGDIRPGTGERRRILVEMIRVV